MVAKASFFLYHPDTVWHFSFFRLVEKRPLLDNFYGMSGKSRRFTHLGAVYQKYFHHN
jgi:hypothetical protein